MKRLVKGCCTANQSKRTTEKVGKFQNFVNFFLFHRLESIRRGHWMGRKEYEKGQKLLEKMYGDGKGSLKRRMKRKGKNKRRNITQQTVHFL